MFEQPDIEKAVKYLSDYITTYTKQSQYKNYDVKTYIDDILYGLGVSINEDEFSFASGFKKFKNELRQHLDRQQ